MQRLCRLNKTEGASGWCDAARAVKGTTRRKLIDSKNSRNYDSKTLESSRIGMEALEDVSGQWQLQSGTDTGDPLEDNSGSLQHSAAVDRGLQAN